MKSQTAYGTVEIQISATLVGTTDQIKMAIKCRDRAIADILSRMTESPVAMRKVTPEMLSNFEQSINSETAATFWINSPTVLRIALLNKMMSK